MLFDGETITGKKGKALREMRRQMQIIFQDPYASLNPRMNVEKIIAEPLTTHKLCADKEERRRRVLELMEEVGIPADLPSVPPPVLRCQRQQHRHRPGPWPIIPGSSSVTSRCRPWTCPSSPRC